MLSIIRLSIPEGSHMKSTSKIIRFIGAFILLCAIPPFGQRMECECRYKWRLTGKEILLQLSDKQGKRPRGIYAIDPFEKKPSPKFLIEGGERPTWSRDRRFIAYIRNKQLWIATRDGNARMAEGQWIRNLWPGEPPVRWLCDGNFATAQHYKATGTLVVVPTHGTPLGSLKDLDWLVHYPLLPLTKGTEITLPGPWHRDKVWLKDILSVRNIDFSPDSKKIVSEVCPFMPEDLGRGKSKVYISDCYDPKAKTIIIQSYYEHFSDLGKRLTTFGDEVAELNPMWSATGEWIAFTVVHYNEGYVAPAVCRPDGTGYTELLPAEPDKYQGYWPEEPEWYPAVLIKRVYSQDAFINPQSKWGTPHAEAVEWSEDGKFLLLNIGDRFSCLAMAKYEDGKWLVGSTMNTGSYTFKTTGSGIEFAATGPAQKGTCWVATKPEWYTDNDICLVNKGSGEKRKYLTIPENFWIDWMDW
jgi:hypothetical protein